MDGIHDMGGTHGWGRSRSIPTSRSSRRTGTPGPSPSGWPRWERPGPTWTRSGTRSSGCTRWTTSPTGTTDAGWPPRSCCWSTAACSRRVPSRPARAAWPARTSTEPADVEVHKPSYERGGPGSLRQIDDKPAFEAGQRVRARELHKPGHTRMPAYVRGRTGVVEARRPAAVLPDSTAHFTGEDAQHVYTVRFESTELWGPDCERLDPVHRSLRELPGGEPVSADPRSVDRPPAALRAEALEELLTERGLVKTEVLDGFINRYVNDVGPLNGAKVVAKAWVDPEYRERLLAGRHRRHQGTGLRRSPGRAHRGRREHRRGAQPRRLHALLLLPVAGPRAAAELVQGPGLPGPGVREPRALLAEMGLDLRRRRRHQGVGLQRGEPVLRTARGARPAPKACPRKSSPPW